MSSTTTIFDGRHDCYFDSDLIALGATTPGALVWSNEVQWTRSFSSHFAGVMDIGVYPRRDDGTCRWGCVDIDTGDFSEALEVFGWLRQAGIGAWIEASGSWKDLTKRGYHVWVFAEDWLPAHYMRALLVEIVHHAGLDPKTEINPKQIEATKKGVGNCVRLPYGRRSLQYPGYSCMTLSPANEFKPFTVAEFFAEVTPTPVKVIDLLGSAAVNRQAMRESVARALAKLRQHEAAVPLFGEQGAGGGTNQRAYRILHGLDRAEDGERNLCAFVMAQHLKGAGRSLAQAIDEIVVAVRRSFFEGDQFVDEAIEVTEKVYRA